MIEIKKKDFQIIIKELEKDYLIDSFFDTLSNLTEIGKDVYNKEFSQKILEKIKNAGNIRIFVAMVKHQVSFWFQLLTSITLTAVERNISKLIANSLFS